MADLPSTTAVHQAVALVVLAGSLLVLWRLEGSLARYGERLRSRFVLGVPWGTLTVVSLVVGFYLVAQHGWSHWNRPVSIAYSSWSYLYPLGWLTAAFAHGGSSHIVGNLTATAVVMPLAEYAYGHFPRERGSGSFDGLLRNPLARAFVLFPGGVAVVGLLTSLLSWGPIIGFSGVVFAAVGFALVRYPLAAVLALVGQEGAVLVYRVLLDPIVVRRATQRFSRPGWAGIAVQGHALGLFLGAAAGIALFYGRDVIKQSLVPLRDADPPSPGRVWLGATLLALSLGLWAVWWYRGGDTYVLYRGLGLAVVAAVAAVVTAAVTASDRRVRGEGWPTRRQFAVLALLLPLLFMAGVAVPLNATTVADAGAPGDGEAVEVRDYTVVYAEDVPNQMVSVVNVSAFGETTQVTASGLIVVSERRHVWTREVSKSNLASTGFGRVVLGGPTWREVVVADRTGWSAVGGGAAYQVRIGRQGEPKRLAYSSGPATAEPVLGGRNVSVEPDADRFLVNVSREGQSLGTAPVPSGNESVTVAGISFAREENAVVARYDGTRVTVFRKETYG